MRRHLPNELQAGLLRAGRRRWCLAAWGGAWLLLAAGLADAQEPPGKAPPEEKQKPPVSLRIVQQGERSHALTRLDVTIEWRRPQPAAAHLVLGVHDDLRRLLEVRSRELALAPGSNRFAMHLPPLLNAAGAGFLTLVPEVVTDEGPIPLDAQVVSVPPTDERRLLVATVAAELGEARERCEALQQGLQRERGLDAQYAVSLQTRFLALKPAELPAAPLELCRFDAVLLHEEGFLSLEAGQLAGLAAWLEGGGALWLVPGTGLKERHFAFLDRLASSSGETRRFEVRDGAATWQGPARAGPLLLNPGVGRAVVQLEPLISAADLEGAPWAAARRFLWGSDVALEAPTRLARGGGGKGAGRAAPVASGLQLDPRHPPVVEPLTELLLPESVQLVPFAALAGILAAFLFIIGPADYFLLGALRRRRLTWLTFPAASVAVTLLVTLLSQHYLGAQSHQAALILVDIGQGNRPVRVNRFELRFPASPRQIELAAEKAFLVPLGAPEFPGGVPAIDGPYPARHAFQQSLRQWQPVLHRTFSFEPAPGPETEPDGTVLGWAEIDEPARAWFQRSGASEPAFLTVLLGASRLADVEVYLIRAEMCFVWTPRGEAMQQVEWTAPPTKLLRALKALSLTGDNEWSHFVARASPTGESNLEDVPLLVPRDPTQGLIIVKCRRGDDIVCWRRLYQWRS